MAAGGMAGTRLASVGDGVALKEQEKKLEKWKVLHWRFEVGKLKLDPGEFPKDWSNLSFPTSNLQCRTFHSPISFFTRLGPASTTHAFELVRVLR
jgi:hypothetical protein